MNNIASRTHFRKLSLDRDIIQSEVDPLLYTTLVCLIEDPKIHELNMMASSEDTRLEENS